MDAFCRGVADIFLSSLLIIFGFVEIKYLLKWKSSSCSCSFFEKNKIRILSEVVLLCFMSSSTLLCEKAQRKKRLETVK
jgi:hypothetical protein